MKALVLSLLLVAPPPQTFDTYLDQAMDSLDLPGVSVVVTHQDRVVYAAGRGHDATGAPVTADTPMRVASLSKSFTAMAVMTLAEDGRIKLDEPVAGQLPGFRMADPRAGRITPRHLLNQTSGFTDRTVGGGLGLGSLRDGTLAAEPGTTWAYCNKNFEVAAQLVAAAAGTTFEEYRSRHIYRPLGMTGSGVPPAEGHVSLFGAWVPRPDLPHGQGSAGVVTTANDMGKWLISQNGHGTQLVTPQGLATMHSPSAVNSYGMGWGPVEVNGTELLVHSGNLFTYSSVQAINPKTGFGYAVMTNSASLYDDVYDIMTGLVALTQGGEPEAPAATRQWIELALGLVALAAVGLAVLGVRRSRRWAARSRRRIVLGFTALALPVAVLAFYPQWVSFISNGRTITWAQMTYFPAPLTVTLVVTATAALTVAAARVIRVSNS